MTNQEKIRRRLGPFERNVLTAITMLNSDGTYASALVATIKDLTRHTPSTSLTYTTLSRLENKGFIRGKLDKHPQPKRGGIRRRFYTITPAGERALSGYPA